MSQRVARARELVDRGLPPGDLPDPEASHASPAPAAGGPVEEAIVEVARDNPTDGYRMVWALTRRKLGIAVNRKRVLRVMREQKLIQRRRREPRRRRPGFFRVERPDQLWHLDMTSIWVAEHGWCYLMAAIDCCTPRDRGLAPRAQMPGSGVDRAGRAGGEGPGNHWFGKLKERLIWRTEFETLDEAREAIGGYVERYHHRPHSGLDYRTPKEVRQTWEDAQDQLDGLRKQAA